MFESDVIHPVDDIGPYGGMAVVLAMGRFERPRCLIHELQPLAWVVGVWKCPQPGCQCEVLDGVASDTFLKQGCPSCGSKDTRKATLFWQCNTCHNEWLEPSEYRVDT
jgi:hypothetical protein